MLEARGVEKYYGARAVLDGVSLTIGPGEKVGLVGRNGCGKSTLLRVLCGVEPPDKGRVAVTRRGLSIGYLPQMAQLEEGESLLEAAVRDLPPGVEEWRVRKSLFGLGFGPAQLQQPARTLSGGEKTRLLLARVLLGEHSLLLLDEPTSHLDVPRMEWLEQVLSGFRGACLVASHDRRFLDRVVSRILELEEGRLKEYAGGYTAYAAARRQALERQREDWALQQRQVRALREFAARKLAWAMASQSGPKRGRDSRGRISEKLARQAHAAEQRIARMERVEKPRDESRLSASFQAPRRSGQVVFEVRDAAVRFDGRSLLEGVNLEVRFGERIGIVGPNGSGKTTLLRLLLGLLTPDSGSVRQGAGVDPYLLAQEQENLDPRLTVLETVETVGRLSHTEARTLLACLLFRDSEVFKRVGTLSGGERVRLGAAAAVVSGANLLVMDEPTNHLDIDTRERLEEALEGYSGTLLVVSHDRWLLDRLTSRTLLLETPRVRDFPGPYSELEVSRQG